MPRLNKWTKRKIIRLIKKGKSLNQIRLKTGVAKTTTYYYMRKLLGRKIVPVNIDMSNIERIGEIIGFFAGDGNFFYDKKKGYWNIRFYFNENETILIGYYKKSLELLTNKLPYLYGQKSVKTLAYKSKELSNFIFNYLNWGNKKVSTIQLKDRNLLKNNAFVIGFLRGLTDSDGYVRKERREIYYGSVSKGLFCDFLKGLDLFNFEYKIYLQRRKWYLDFHKVRLTGSEVDRFVNLIKPLKRL